MKVFYLVSHAIQYHAPILRRLSAHPDIDLLVIFRSDIGQSGYVDAGFGGFTKWDSDLLGGYKSIVLKSVAGRDRPGWIWPINFGLYGRLRRERPTALWIHGLASVYSLYALIAAKSLGIKTLLRDDVHERRIVRGRARRLASITLFKFLSVMVDGFLCVGTANRQYLLKRGIPVHKLYFAPNVVDNDFFGESSDPRIGLPEQPVASGGTPAGRCTELLFVGKLVRGKRCSDLLEAVARILKHNPRPGIAITIVGDGPERKALEAQAQRLSVAHIVTFEGFKNQSELSPYYRRADIMVMPSESESWGLAVNEAMAAGCAILASTAVVATDDLVRPDNGIIFPVGDINAIAAAIMLYVDNPAELQAAKRSSRSRISEWGTEQFTAGFVHALKAVGSRVDRASA